MPISIRTKRPILSLRSDRALRRNRALAPRPSGRPMTPPRVRYSWVWSANKDIRTMGCWISSTIRSTRAAAPFTRAVFDNEDGRFTPGLFARIKLVANDSYDAILIDERAVGNDLGKKFVFVLKPDSTLEYRPITLGTRIDGLRVVDEGLQAADTIVVNGLQHVMAGAANPPRCACRRTQSCGGHGTRRRCHGRSISARQFHRLRRFSFRRHIAVGQGREPRLAG
jgi:hypothetical protein